jgi:hypothetical protein
MSVNMKKKLLERLDQAILAVSDNPEKTQQTAAIGTLLKRSSNSNSRLPADNKDLRTGHPGLKDNNSIDWCCPRSPFAP